MFEKEAKERARELEESQTVGIYVNDEDLARDIGWNEGEVAGYEEGFKDGAEFGYNKAFVEADKNLKAIVTDFNKAKELIEELSSSLSVVGECEEEECELLNRAEQFLRKSE